MKITPNKTMKLVCPGCGLTASAESWLNDAVCRETLQAVAKLPSPLPQAALPYLGLFRPESRALSWSKALKIVGGLAGLAGSGHVQVQGKVARPCPARIWAQAMEQMVERRESIRRPLPNHNYLRQVAWQLADEEDARAEESRRQREAAGGRIGGHGGIGGHDPNRLLGSGSCPPVPYPLRPATRSPMDDYIQGLRPDKPDQAELDQWKKERLK